ncbi:MAG TPA: pilus assembly protein TadG-related protein [Anaeromyxobacteraceae bacterium]|jgi:Flp pilus assembly protein TadG|nr:pilus assembly protein TadG-related protein [Anaeromyxobacteraceae bacterium]
MCRGSRGRRPERGAVAVVVAILLTVLVAFAGLVMNVGHSRMVRGQLQNAVDAAALAGAVKLNGTSAGVSAARAAAVAYAGLNVTDVNTSVVIDPDADVQVGFWDFTKSKDAAFTPLTGSAADLPYMVAVRVIAGRQASRSNAVPVWMAPFLTTASGMDVTAEAVAVGAGPKTNSKCALPFVIPSCAIDPTFLACCAASPPPPGTTSPCDTPVDFVLQSQFANNNVDTIGLTALTSGSANNAAFRAMVADPNSCPQGTVGSTITIQNGNNFNKPFYDDLTNWLAAHNNQGEVPVATMTGCPSPTFNQTATLAAFATVTVTLQPWSGGATPKFELKGQIHCASSSATAGGPWMGTSSQTGLVR